MPKFTAGKLTGLQAADNSKVYIIRRDVNTINTQNYNSTFLSPGMIGLKYASVIPIKAYYYLLEACDICLTLEI
jgi:hypothetical protein